MNNLPSCPPNYNCTLTWNQIPFVDNSIFLLLVAVVAIVIVIGFIIRWR